MTDTTRHAILILGGASAYGSLNAFNTEIARAIRARGLDPILLDLRNPQSFNQTLAQTLADYPNRIGAAIGFSGYGSELTAEPNGQNIWEKLRIPMISWLVDHPCYFLSRHQTPTPAVMRIYSAPDFLSFHRTHVRAPYRTGYVDLGAMDFGRTPAPRHITQGQTPLILFPKSFPNPAELEQVWKLLPLLMQKIIRDGIDHYWGQTARSGEVTPSLLAAADAAGVELRNDLPLLTFFVTQLDDYIRRLKGVLVLRQLLPLPVRIYAQNIDFIDTAHSRAHILPTVDYDTLIDLFTQATALISLNPNVDHGAHDRVHAAFGTGALPISDINPWLTTQCPALLPYSYDFHHRPITEAIERVLADPQAAAETGWQTSLERRRHHSLDHRVQEILDFALMHRYFTFNFEPPQAYYAKCGD